MRDIDTAAERDHLLAREHASKQRAKEEKALVEIKEAVRPSSEARAEASFLQARIDDLEYELSSLRSSLDEKEAMIQSLRVRYDSDPSRHTGSIMREIEELVHQPSREMDGKLAVESSFLTALVPRVSDAGLNAFHSPNMRMAAACLARDRASSDAMFAYAATTSTLNFRLTSTTTGRPPSQSALQRTMPRSPSVCLYLPPRPSTELGLRLCRRSRLSSLMCLRWSNWLQY